MTDYPGLIDSLTTEEGTKIVFFIMDGVGGLHIDGGRKTELETARTPHLDELARRSSKGLLTPIAPGITTGSGPGHFALFGYDPVDYNVGRGVLEAAGIGFDLTDRDVAVRGNYATVDKAGNITDRRAGRISTDVNERVSGLLQEGVRIDGVEIFVRPVKEHRVLVVFRGEGLGGDLADTDPQETGVPPLEPRATDEGSKKTASIVREFVSQAVRILAEEKQANMITLRGFAKHKRYPSLKERFKLNSLCLANYPMYRGVAFLIGMEMHPITPNQSRQLAALKENFDAYDFFFLHAKTTDKTGEDGDFNAKVAAIEELDALLPEILELEPDVLVITGDHSTPSALRSHSWHPVPVLLASEFARIDGGERFTERDCLKGALGQFQAKHLMALALGHARRLKKFGA